MNLAELEARVARLEAALQHTVRNGKVTQTYPDRGTVRVQFEDADEIVSHECAVLSRSTLKDKSYNMPDIGEQVAVMFQGHGQEAGYIVGCPYSQPDGVPVASQDKCHQAFGDGTTMEYDRESSALNIKAVGTIRIEAAGQVTIIGNPIHLNP